MNLKQLIDQFDLVTDTEEGLEQLRKVILNQAVGGNLTKQESSDEPAKRLLERITAEKQRLYDEGEIRKPKDLPKIEEKDIPFKIPSKWKWVRFGDLGISQTGTTPKTSVSKYYGDYIPFIGPGDISNGDIDYSNRALSEAGLEKGRLIPKGSIIMVCIGGSIGKSILVDRDVSCNQQINTIYPLCGTSSEIINLFVKAGFFQDVILEKASGSATPIINKTKWKNLLFPLPPLEEQQRIVQKIETLFSQVDELEQKVQQDQEVDERLQVAVLDDLQSAETPEASRQSWQRLTDHFEQIYRKPEHIDQLKQTILNEAVRGRLVPQDTSDEPAEKLLERIKKEKQRLYDEGEIRKPKVLDPVSNEEVPFGLPQNWQWVRLGDICQLITDGAHHTPNYIEDGVRFISVKNISGGEIDFTDCKYISEEEHEKLSQRCNPERGDILLTKVGTTGIPVVVETDIEFSIFVSVALLKINTDFVNPYFLKYLIQSPLVYSQSIENTRGVGNQNLVLRDINNFTIPFMPYKDQVKLTEEIERYFTWCDDLKEKLSSSQQTEQRLLEALVNGAV